MSIKFDYSAQLRNSYLLTLSSSRGTFVSEGTHVTGVFVETFRALFNPGHQNNSSAFEYFTNIRLSGPSSVKWEFKERGSTTWVAFTTGRSTFIGTNFTRTGVYETSAVALPMSIRCMIKTSAIGGTIYVTNESSYLCAIRAWGPIAT